MLESYTYLHCKPDGTPFYVGKGTKQRVNSTSERNRYYGFVVAKYGKENILTGSLSCSSDEIAFELEKGIIKCLKRMGVKLTNMSEGGEGFAQGHTPWNKGKAGCCSEKTRKKMRASHDGKILTEEHKKAIGDAILGYTHKEVRCPHCSTVGGETGMKRWHFNNCKGKRGEYRARVTIRGQRLDLGRYTTQAEADSVMINKYKEEGVLIPKEFYKQGTGRNKLI